MRSTRSVTRKTATICRLFMIENDEEWAIVEETFNTLVDELDGGAEND